MLIVTDPPPSFSPPPRCITISFMTLHRLSRIQRLPITQDVAWAFFGNPKNLRAITPGWLDFSIAADTPSEIYPGAILRYTIRFLGVKLAWVTEITHVHAPEYFVDEQRFGPYRFWHHQHHLRPLPDGVEVEDIVHYMIPAGFFGRLAHGLVVRRQLNEIFDYRQRMLEDYFGSV